MVNVKVKSKILIEEREAGLLTDIVGSSSSGHSFLMVQRVYHQIKTVDEDATIIVAANKSQVSAIKNQMGEQSTDVKTEYNRFGRLSWLKILFSHLFLPFPLSHIDTHLKLM